MRVKIRRCQVIKLIENRFCRCTGKYKALGLNAQTSQARSVLLRPRALYSSDQHKKPVSMCIEFAYTSSAGRTARKIKKYSKLLVFKWNLIHSNP